MDWWEWGEEAFAEAKRRDVPVLISVGYSTCSAGDRAVTAEDWQRSAEVFADLADPAVMEAAWR